MDIHTIDSAVRRSATITFARSGGPGGQNVNKVSSKAVLHLHVDRFAAQAGLSEAEAVRIRVKLARKVNENGELVLAVQDTRDQAKNREIAVQRAAALVAAALHRPKRRVKTRPSAGSRESRLSSKKRRGADKRLRGSRPEAD
jgi:ribosome-associated protein